MKVALHVVQGRRQRLASLLRSNGYLPLAEVCSRLGVSAATARRDLVALEADKALKRTYGGALADYDQGFASFRDRQRENREGKTRIARAALTLVKPGSVIYMDAGTTVHALAEAIAIAQLRPLTVVTNNIPVAEALSGLEQVQVELIAGRFAARQRVVLGERAERSLAMWRFEAAFLSAEGMDAEGLWNSHAEVVALQRAIADMAPLAAFCIDSSKLGRSATAFLLPWREVGRLVTDADAAALREAGIKPRANQLLAA